MKTDRPRTKKGNAEVKTRKQKRVIKKVKSPGVTVDVDIKVDADSEISINVDTNSEEQNEKEEITYD